MIQVNRFKWGDKGNSKTQIQRCSSFKKPKNSHKYEVKKESSQVTKILIIVSFFKIFTLMNWHSIYMMKLSGYILILQAILFSRFFVLSVSYSAGDCIYWNTWRYWSLSCISMWLRFFALRHYKTSLAYRQPCIN